ncbi:MAG: T9SS type A sorting domain-containing protein [Candidatus Kapabacteria bacterium]|nr:T9SS type A sorting domain-containing protein [Ignavibacteria bacterium]MBP6509066.1 T9SS type A sorting domain-containing protein [Candidatus Kapabacteria bacterium]MBP7092913.1 T9SS type A sorting domain-containing protein [Candidatus Kapabacteria bacterium]
MQRWFRLSSLLLVLTTAFNVALSQSYVEVRGSLPPGSVRVFVRDTIYRISGSYTVGGTLLIEPGTRVEFLPNGRLVDSTGGRIIADGRASATYDPNAVNPLLPPYTGYDDPTYFGAPGVVASTIATEPTIHPSKYPTIFNVDLGSNPNLQGLTPAKAIMYKAARLELGSVISAIRLNPWFRPTGQAINVRAARITFVAGDVNNFSREWGHIVVLPGSRAAFFRDVDFLNFRKDTTVDNEPVYLSNNSGQSFTRPQAETANDLLLRASNGGGGAITTFSSRTWIIGCVFRNNMARYRGGALQVLQAPVDQYASTSLQLWPIISQATINALPQYPATVNPFLTDPTTAQPINQGLRITDRIYDSAPETFTDVDRQSIDDARLAMYLGRIRQIRFTSNRTLLSDVDTVRIGGIRVVTDANRPATVFATPGRSQKNESFGGAVYISGRNPMIVGFGINDFQGKDTIEFNSNYAENRQPSTTVGNNVRTSGARGGAVHVADQTSVIFAGRYTTNKTTTPFITDVSSDPTNSVGNFSQGGGIYAASGARQIQIRGNLDNNPPTHFLGNESARGGAVYVAAGVNDTLVSPWIGGSDGIINARNYGFNIKFRDNRASVDGGAVFTARNMVMYGAGGTSGPLWIYGTNYGVEFQNNTANFSGGAICVNIPNNLPIWRRTLRYVRGTFFNNRVGEVADSLKASVRGGGGIYSINADLNVVKGVEFRANKVWNGNGGAIAVVTPDTLTRKRFFVTDLDEINYNSLGVAIGYMPRNEVFTFQTSTPRADERMLTRFYDNVATENPLRQGSGTTQRGDIKVVHPGTTLRENGTGLGGAYYILDSVRVRVDTIAFDRVRFQNNTAFTGAAVYSDNYDLKLAFARCLVTGNKAVSDIGRANDSIRGPLVSTENPASSDLAGAVLYGEVTGPLPWTTYSFAANSIYDNDARFIIRLPDAQDTKGVLAGTTGIGFGGVDTLRGNYWGRTEANINTILPVSANNSSFGRIQETFFIAGNGKTHMRFMRQASNNVTEQGPFESAWRYNYKPIPTWTIPDTLLLEGRIYDIFDKGTDIKTADYSNRRMSPIEDFAVGIPPVLKVYTDPTMPSYNKYVKRTTRNPFDAEMYADIAAVQTEFIGNHPIGYPVFLEARADYSATAEISNNDPRALNETVFFVINERTGDYIRTNMKQKNLTDTIFRSRVELVPDSTNGGDPNIRRAYEGLATYGTGATLLSFIADNAVAEDSSALQGRKWEGSTILGELGGNDFRLGNRPTLPTSNAMNGDGGKETYFGGERYRALPVREGDQVTIVSRTILWKDGVVNAINGGLTFTVGNNTNPPQFTGAADTLGTSPLIHPEMRNRVFVSENRLYTPVTAAQSPRGGGRGSWFNEPPSYPSDATGTPIPGQDIYERDSIFTITAVDVNKFYDPRVINDSTFNSQLSYFWNITTGNSALRYWLRDTLVRASSTNNPRWGAQGYRMLRGRPINPYIVPGGEEIEVVTKNFPPSLELVDTLRKSGVGEDVISRWFYIYPSYFHAEEYDNNSIALDQRNPDNTNARFLQQDTVNFGWLDTSAYRFRIHVVDSMPRFLWNYRANASQAVTYQGMLKGDSTIVLDPTTTDPGSYDAATGTYLDTLRMYNTESRVGRRLVQPNAILDEVYNDPAAPQPDDLNVQFVANLTDSLRFRLDVNTDDEYEDLAAVDTNRAVVKQYGVWDFRYGKTAYGFLSTSIRQNPDDVVVDEVLQARPIWLATRYMRRYQSAGTVDQFAEDFTTRGRIEVRIDGTEAREILKPTNDFNPGNPINGDLNTDTVMTVVVNDGHGGLNTLTRRLFVNVQPQLLDANLAEANEDVDYNVALIDSSRRINVYDPNFGQAQSFELIYIDESRDSILVDPYFPEAGSFTLDGSRKTTPKWLKINPTSGLLYGTPRVTDLPYADTTVLVTVVVTDAGQLKDIRSYNLTIRARNHDPRLFSSPIVKCVEQGKPYTDTLKVTDIDLRRTQADNEQLTFEVIESTGTWTFTPERLSSPIADTQTVVISTTNLTDVPVNGRITIKVVVTDRQGVKDTLVYQVAVSDETEFVADVRVENNLGAFQILTFGTGSKTIATTGDEITSFGNLDSNYCEYELPPVPYVDVFDARWTIPTRNGILRNIFPFKNTPGDAIYRARFQAGGETGQSSAYYPVKLSWCPAQLPALSDNKGSYYLRDDQSNGQLFAYDMKTGAGRSASDIRLDTVGACYTLVISRDAVRGFIIVYDFASGVDDEDPTTDLSITSTAPNPFSTSTAITFNVPTTKNVAVEIYDAIGTRVATLANDVFTAGSHTIEWNGLANGVMMSSGLYTVRVTDGVRSSTQQVVFVR